MQDLAVPEVDDLSDLRETPAQRAARIVRYLPEHFAKPLAPLRPLYERKIGQQRPCLFRRRQGNDLAKAKDGQISENANFERHFANPSRC
ncbi:hypothetical protein [Mesorhizobium sp. M0228]|uniref:hypothetical protein n=1 Tax=Mesorhizobium sp. M0228 TaxID=2956923 RepID=UPI00333A3DB3